MEMHNNRIIYYLQSSSLDLSPRKGIVIEKDHLSVKGVELWGVKQAASARERVQQ